MKSYFLFSFFCSCFSERRRQVPLMSNSFLADDHEHGDGPGKEETGDDDVHD